MKRYNESSVESDLLNQLDNDSLSVIVLHVFDMIDAYFMRRGVWSHWVLQDEEEHLPRYDRHLQPYSIFMINHELKRKLDLFSHRERFRIYALITSKRVWISNEFYKRLLLPKGLIFQPRLLSKLMAENNLFSLLKKASPKAIKLVYNNLMQHWKAACIARKKSWKVVQYIENTQETKDSFSEEDYKKVLLATMKYPLIETCQCRFCLDKHTINCEEYALLKEVAYRERLWLCSNINEM